MSNSKDNKEEPTKNGKRFTHDKTHTLSIKENVFIDKYIELGNATQAAIEAGYSAKTAKSTANRMLTKDYINGEIKYRTTELYAKNAATSEEVMNFFAKVMRGEIKDQFGLEAPLSERTKAAQEIAKRTVDIDNRLAGKSQNTNAEVKITLDWARPDTDVQKVEIQE